MAHSQKPDFVFRAKRTSPFKSAGGRQFSQLLAAEVCAISGSNPGYTMFRGSVKGTGYPMHSPVSPSLPHPASPCAITFQLESTEVNMYRGSVYVEASRNVMAHAQKPDLIFRAKRTSPFKSAGGRQFSRLLAAEVCAISGSNAGYTVFRGSVKSNGYPLHLNQ